MPIEQISRPETDMALDEQILAKVTAEALVGRNKGSVLTKAFFWRVILDYIQDKKLTPNNEESQRFYDLGKDKIAELLDKEKVAYKNDDLTVKPIMASVIQVNEAPVAETTQGSKDWYRSWDDDSDRRKDDKAALMDQSPRL